MKNIQKVTERGQITLPKKWRQAHDSPAFVRVETKKQGLVITLPSFEDDEEVIWSADRDNDGVGIPAEDFVKILDKVIASKK